MSGPGDFLYSLPSTCFSLFPWPSFPMRKEEVQIPGLENSTRIFIQELGMIAGIMDAVGQQAQPY